MANNLHNPLSNTASALYQINDRRAKLSFEFYFTLKVYDPLPIWLHYASAIPVESLTLSYMSIRCSLVLY